jgi:hypothetical protein
VEVDKLIETIAEHEDGYRNFLNDRRFTRKILFGRINVDQQSLLEKMLQNSEFIDFLDDIWRKFQLFEKPEILLLVSYPSQLVCGIIEYTNLFVTMIISEKSSRRVSNELRS